MVNYASIFSLFKTPQSEPIGGTIANSAGGYAFPVDDWVRLDRFLVLGSEGGSYYAGQRALTRENAEAVIRCIAADGVRTVARIVEVSAAGRAPKNEPAIFALALATALGDEAAKRAAFAAVPKVCRTGTHLFQFAESVQAMRGWGRGLRRAVAGWYLSRPVDELAYQAIKYQQRNGWSHRDLLRLAHPLTDEIARRDLFDWVCRGTVGAELPVLVGGFVELAKAESAAEVAALIRRHDLPREAVPTQWLNEPVVWEALLERMPMTALLRNLAKLTAVGVAEAARRQVAGGARGARRWRAYPPGASPPAGGAPGVAYLRAGPGRQGRAGVGAGAADRRRAERRLLHGVPLGRAERQAAAAGARRLGLDERGACRRHGADAA